jgi:hypothetical protein
MAPAVIALPISAARVVTRLARRAVWPVLAVTVIYRAIQRPGSPPAARVAPDPGPVGTRTATPDSPPSAAPREPELVIDPVALPEPAVDLDVEVTLASELPIRSYDALAAADAVHVIRELTDAEEVSAVLRFEEENAKRDEVLAAAREHLAAVGQPTPR